MVLTSGALNGEATVILPVIGSALALTGLTRTGTLLSRMMELGNESVSLKVGYWYLFFQGENPGALLHWHRMSQLASTTN
jgi:hypothetical protein